MSELHTLLQRVNPTIKVDLHGREEVRTQRFQLADHMIRKLEKCQQEQQREQNTLWTTGSSIWMEGSTYDETYDDEERRDDIMRRGIGANARKPPRKTVGEEETRIKPPATSAAVSGRKEKIDVTRKRTETSVLYDPTGLEQFEQQLLSQFGNNDNNTTEGVIPNPYIWNKDPIDAMKTYNRVRKPNPYENVPKRVYNNVNNGNIGRRERDEDEDYTAGSNESGTYATYADYETVTLGTIDEDWILRKPSGTQELFSCFCCLPGEMP